MLSSSLFTTDEASDLLRDVLEASLTTVAFLRPCLRADGPPDDFIVEYVNPAGQQFWQLPAQPAATLLDLWPEARTNGLLPFYQQVFTTGQAGHFAFDHAVAEHGVLRLRVSARRTGGRLLVHMLAEPRTTTAAALRESLANEAAAYTEANRQRAQLYRVLEQAPAMISVFDGPDHVFQFVNPPYQALVGNRPLLGLPIAQAMPELKDQPIFGLLDHVYRTGETFHANEMLVQLDHQNDSRQELDKRYYNFIYQARRNALGAIDGIFAFAYEVTPLVAARQQMQRHNAELEARVTERTRAAQLAQATAEQQRTQLNQLFMQAPGAICVLEGPTWVYQFVNPSYQQVFPGRTLLGKPLLEALPELSATDIPETLGRVYATGAPYQAQERLLHLARTEGGPLEEMYWSFTYQARRDTAGRIDGVLVFAYDVTDQVRARHVIEASQRQTQALADELSQTNARLTRANSDLDSFLHTASHDLKAPITNIEGLLQVLQQELPPPAPGTTVAKVLHLMQDSIGRFQRTIKYLTDVTKLQSAQRAPATPVVLQEVVQGVCLDLAPLLAVSNGQVVLTPDSCATVTFAEKDLRSIIYNLISNALKYRAPERTPCVQVRCYETSARHLALEVQDNGLGLSEEQRQRVFGMFQRLHDHVEGSGMGLYLVKKVVENAGGRIEVESLPGAGSTFRVLLQQGDPLAS